MESSNTNNTTISTKTAKKGNFGRSLTNHSKRSSKVIKTSNQGNETGIETKPKSGFMRKVTRSKVTKEDKVRLVPTENTTIITKKPKDDAVKSYKARRMSMGGNVNHENFDARVRASGICI